MNYPDDLLYTNEHEWLRVEDGNTVCVGITDFAQNELGEIVFVDVTTLGEELNKEEPFGSIEAVKAVSDLFMPVSGKVLEVNPELDDHPELVNEDPYGKGWIIRVEMTNEEEKNGLLSAKEYNELLNE